MDEDRHPRPYVLRPVVLEGRLVRLEPLEERHLEDILAVGLDPAIWRWTIEDNERPERLRAHVAAALAEREAGTQLPFATVERTSGRVAGATRYMSLAPAHLRLEVGWTWLAPAWQGRGLNDDSKLLQLRHAFEVLGCRRVEFKTDALNERSRAALAAIGASFEGVFREHMVSRGGRMRDSAWYSVIEGEWPAVKAHLEARVAAHAGSAPEHGSEAQDTESTR